MDKFSLNLTIVFDGQFYIGIFEQVIGDTLMAAKTVFGAEPSNNDIARF